MAPFRGIHRRVKTGCSTCRKRHIKCDEKRPKCRHCQVGHRECHYEFAEAPQNSDGSPRGSFQFSPNHVWIDTPSEVTFVHAVDVREEDVKGEENTELSPKIPISGHGDSGILEAASASREHAAQASTPHNDHVTQTTPGPSRDAINLASPHYTASITSMDTLDPFKSLIGRRMTGSALYTREPIQPSNDPLTARLLWHYTHNLACWLDVNDPQRQFETFVPHLALSCPILLHAVLAFSACHLGRFDGSCDPLRAADYHDLSVQGIIPALADPATALDNVLPISTVVLRMYEMVSSETDQRRHLKGASSLFTHNRKNIGFRALKRTAFWTYFREEIMVALATGKPTTIGPKVWKADVAWAGDTDHVKTEKMTMLTAEVVDFCFSEEVSSQESNTGRWDELQREVDEWTESLPETFQPVYVIEDSHPFPEIMYLCTWHIIAMQFFHLVKVLLALHNPHRPGGMGFLRFARAVEDETVKNTIQLCGMTRALRDRHPGALVNAVQPLMICGRTLTNEEQQDELVRMLQRIEQVTAIPTSPGIESLLEAWGR